MAKLAGLVLAGGASRRMGRDKARLLVGGRTLADIMAEKLRAAGCTPVLLSGNDGIADLYPGMGPLAGIHAAFGHLNGVNAMIVVPVDMPELGVQSLQKIAETDGEAVCFEHQSLPLKIVLTARVKTLLVQTLSTPGADLSIRNFVRGLEMQTLNANKISTGELANINTPEDLKTWENNHEA